MFKSTRELKAFISWAKKNGASRVVAGEVSVEFSESKPVVAVPAPEFEAIMKDSGLDFGSEKEMNLDGSKVFVDDAQEEDEETLFWSSPSFKG